MMQRTTPSRRGAQRGMSMFGLMAWATIAGFSGYLAVRVLPPVAEFLTVQRAVDRVAAESPALAADAIARNQESVGLQVLAFPKEEEYFVELRLPALPPPGEAHGA